MLCLEVGLGWVGCVELGCVELGKIGLDRVLGYNRDGKINTNRG